MGSPEVGERLCSARCVGLVSRGGHLGDIVSGGTMLDLDWCLGWVWCMGIFVCVEGSV